MKNKLILLLTISVLAFSCTDREDDALAKTDGINIRIRNASEFHYTDVIVKSGDEEFTYGTINSNHTSNYQQFKLAYQYAYVQLKINGKVYILQPIDFVGEEELANGKYTYEIDAAVSENEYDGLTLLFVED